MKKSLSSQSIQAKWTGGFLGERLGVCRTKMIPHMWSLLNNPEISHCWQNFLIAAGEAEGEHSGPPFHDGDFYKWLEGASRLYGNSSDPDWTRRLDSIIEILTKVQREDGYIFTYDAIQRRKGRTGTAMTDNLNFEVYNMGHLMSAGCVHYTVSGKKTLLLLAEKAAQYLIGQFSARENATARTAICPSHYMGLAQLYKTTSKREYLDLLERLIALRDHVPNGTDDNQDRIPLKQQREILGHAVRANYLYAGLTDLYQGKGDEDYKLVLESVWNDLVSKKLSLTGGCGALYDGVSPYGWDDYDYIQRTHQSYGRAYELPNTNGYNETCAAIGFYLWNYRMAHTFGCGKYADYMERALYNSILSGINLEGDRYFYTNALRTLENLPSPLKWSRHREPYLSSFCCPPNVVRTIAETADLMCIPKEEGLAVLLYGTGEITFTFPDGGKAVLTTTSDYPWSGRIGIRIDSCHSPETFPLYLRIPEWAAAFSISINSVPWESPSADHDGFACLERIWKTNDQIILDLTMDIQRIESHPMVEESRNHMALQRGPVVYCLETEDLPDHCALDQVYIDPESPFSAVSESIGSTRMIVLKGYLWHSAGSGWQESGLYRPYNQREFEKIPVRLIPYFAWDNRKKGEMTVWLPLLPGKPS